MSDDMAASSVAYLTSLPSIRDRANVVYKAAQLNQLTNFDFDESRLNATADLVTSVILESYPLDELSTIPPHGRWQHFEVGGVPRVSRLLKQWRAERPIVDDIECCRRLVDLFIVSVLLDAGAGNDWHYVEDGTNCRTERSEGLAVASLHMYLNGKFGSTKVSGGEFKSVDGAGLCDLSPESLAEGMQVSATNPMTGLQGRAELLQRVGNLLLEKREIFGAAGRPGNLVDYLRNMHPTSELDLTNLWACLQALLLPAWPKDRHTINGQPIGDAWPVSILTRMATASQSRDDSCAQAASCIQPFHKLTQWLAYSLTTIFTRVLGSTWSNMHLLTGLPEYRNGGLFVDMGVLTLKSNVSSKRCRGSEDAKREQQEGKKRSVFAPESDVIVEWRAVTVVLLDQMLILVNQKLSERMRNGGGGNGTSTQRLSLAQMLEAGTWKAGRILAQKFRPGDRSSPILVQSDGTLF